MSESELCPTCKMKADLLSRDPTILPKRKWKIPRKKPIIEQILLRQKRK